MKFLRKAEILLRDGKEAVEKTVHSIAVKTYNHLTLEERVARAVRGELARAQEMPEDDFSWEFKDGDDFSSPHELVFDEGLGKEITRAEKFFVDRQRSKFDSYVTEAKKKAKAKKQAVNQGKQRVKEQEVET